MNSCKIHCPRCRTDVFAWCWRTSRVHSKYRCMVCGFIWSGPNAWKKKLKPMEKAILKYLVR